MSNNKIILKTRAIIEVFGIDRRKFLQGLITNDINKASNENLIYSAMLNNQGRFLYDFFIFELNETLVIDCLLSRRDEILQKLNFYKLRSKVEIKKNDEILICFAPESENLDYPEFIDPRNKNLGYRSYVKQAAVTSQNNDESFYDYLRIKNKVAEGEKDLTYEKSFIAEFGFDELNAIDYNKGCYVGQEPTARIHHLGEIRKKIYHIKIDISKQKPDLETKSSQITCEGKSVGIVLSSIFFENELHALALVRISEGINFEDNQILLLGENKINIIG